jgi:uncharacterized protein
VPVGGAERIAALDLLRGVAVLGILLVNIWTYAMPFPAALNPGLEGWEDRGGRAAVTLTHLLAYNKFMPLFSTLFGAGIVLFTSRVEQRGGRSGRRWFARQWWLWLIGMLHAYLLWSGDILVPYAVVGLLLYRLRRLRPRTLVVLALIVLAVPKFTMYGVAEFMNGMRAKAAETEAVIAAGDTPTDEQQKSFEFWRDNGARWNPTPEQMAELTATMRGGYVGIVSHAAKELVGMHAFMYPAVVGWAIAGYMLLGMGLFKTGLLTGAYGDRTYATMAIVGYGVGLPAAWVAMHYQESIFFDLIAMMRTGFLAVELTGPIVVCGHVGLILLACRRRWLPGLQGRLRAVGRMAFTNYLSQNVIGVLIFYGWGFGLWGRLHRVELLGVMVLIWAAQLWWSPWWLARYRFGPVEWLWRSLTYRRRQPMVR